MRGGLRMVLFVAAACLTSAQMGKNEPNLHGRPACRRCSAELRTGNCVLRICGVSRMAIVGSCMMHPFAYVGEAATAVCIPNGEPIDPAADLVVARFVAAIGAGEAFTVQGAFDGHCRSRYPCKE